MRWICNSLITFQLIVILTKGEEQDKKLSRNYASYECGAKVITSNPEAQGTSHILKESKDEYMLNPCKAKKWFVVELCEPIQPSAVELANFELFSSTPKEMLVQGYERFPTQTWINLGTFVANDSRELQRFEIKPQSEFIKFIKIEIISHYGSEHFCPFSLIRVFGVSLVEDFDAIESGQTQQVQPNPLPTSHDAPSSTIHQPVKDESSNSGSSENKSSVENPPSGDVTHPHPHPHPLDPPPRDSVLTMVRQVFTPDPTVSEVSPASEETTNEITVDPVTAGDGIMTEQETQVYDSNLHRHLVDLLPRISHLFTPSKCHDSTIGRTGNHSSVVESGVCLYLRIILGSRVYEALVQEAGKELTSLYTCELENGRKSNEGTRGEEGKRGEEGNGSNLIPSQMQPIFDTLYALVTPSYDSVSTQETQVPASLSSGGVGSGGMGSGGMGSGGVGRGVENVTRVDGVNETETGPLSPTPVVESVLVSAIDTSFESPSTSTSVVAASSSKESIFIKINNRIKALEQNMSVSGGLIDELMTRHREQMVEVQRAFNQTHETFSEIKNTTMMIQDELRSRISSLETQLALSDEQVSLLTAEKELFHWQLILCHVILLLIQLSLIVIAANIYIRRISRIAMAVTGIDEARSRITMAVSGTDEARSRITMAVSGTDERSGEGNERKKQRNGTGLDEEENEEKSIQYHFINQSGDVSTTSSSMFDTQSFEGVDHTVEGSSCDWSSGHIMVDSNTVEGSSCDWSSGQIMVDSNDEKVEEWEKNLNRCHQEEEKRKGT